MCFGVKVLSTTRSWRQSVMTGSTNLIYSKPKVTLHLLSLNSYTRKLFHFFSKTFLDRIHNNKIMHVRRPWWLLFGQNNASSPLCKFVLIRNKSVSIFHSSTLRKALSSYFWLYVYIYSSHHACTCYQRKCDCSNSIKSTL